MRAFSRNQPNAMPITHGASSNDAQNETLLSRRQLARRWSCHCETIKRKTAAGLLHPLRFNARMLRYKLSEIEAIEAAAGGAQ